MRSERAGLSAGAGRDAACLDSAAPILGPSPAALCTSSTAQGEHLVPRCRVYQYYWELPWLAVWKCNMVVEVKSGDLHGEEL